MLGTLAALVVWICVFCVNANAQPGRASYYGAPGEPYLNKHTANGEQFRPGGLTCAHRTFPMGTHVMVIHNGRQVVCRVNDRGPAAWTGRDLDLSYGAARVIGLIQQGVANVKYYVIGY